RLATPSTSADSWTSAPGPIEEAICVDDFRRQPMASPDRNSEKVSGSQNRLQRRKEILFVRDLLFDGEPKLLLVGVDLAKVMRGNEESRSWAANCSPTSW